MSEHYTQDTRVTFHAKSGVPLINDGRNVAEHHENYFNIILAVLDSNIKAIKEQAGSELPQYVKTNAGHVLKGTL